MRNISVRTMLVGAVALFAAVIFIISGSSFLMLDKSNDSTVLVHEAERRVILINDVYKDSARTRAGHALVYASLLKNGKAEDWIFGNIKRTYDRMLAKVQEFNTLPIVMQGDEAIKAELVESANALGNMLDKATTLLQAGNADAYFELNITGIDKAGARFSQALEKYQKSSQEAVNDIVATRQQEFHRLQWIMGLSLAVAIALTLTLLHMLRTVVLRPLADAIAHLDQVAKGDLTAHIQVPGNNEMGRLLGSISGMQESLAQLVGSVRRGADGIATSSGEIEAGNQDLSSRTEEQASALQQTAASMEQLSSTVRQNADNALQANQMAMSASSVAVQGGAVVAEVVETMKSIDESSNKIADIISVIDGIAFQTNILALNAAVEAARAGEQGRGFAVVASEVRALAGRSADAAKEIKQLIGTSVERVGQGTQLVDKAGSTMTEVVTAIRRVTDLMGEISAASHEQSSGVSQVGEAVTQMDQTTQQNAALVEEMAAAASSLNNQARSLVDAVAVFKLSEHEPSIRSAMPAARVSTAKAAKSAKPVQTVKAAAPAPKASLAAKPAALRRPPAIAAQPSAGKDDGEWETF